MSDTSIFTGKPPMIQRRNILGSEIWKNRNAYLFVAPFFILFTIFMLYPILDSFVTAFTSRDISSYNSFVGFSNFTRMFQDELFQQALRNTLIYTAIYMAIGPLLSLGTAMLLNRDLRFGALVRVLVFLPPITLDVASVLVWRNLYDEYTGVLNSMLEAIHLPTQGWLTDPKWALLSVTFYCIWQGFGYNAIIYLAGLKSIPQDLYEAGDIDGTDGWTRFRYITLPMVAPTTLFVMVMTGINCMQVFNPMMIFTHGGPMNATMTLGMLVHKSGFINLDFGYAAAVGYVICALTLVLSLIQFLISRERKTTER